MTKLSIVLSAPKDHVQGDLGAECILVEYGDYRVPVLRAGLSNREKATEALWRSVLLLCFRNFPLSQIHPMGGTSR